jgi:multiple sugar transport system ATP-binding protein
VALARAIVRRPNVFLMDEPLSNLDAKLRVSTRAQIMNLSHELKITTVYVTHDQVEAMTLADRVVVMKHGVTQQIGTPTEIYDRPANTFVAGFIGSPGMNLINGRVQDGAFLAHGTRVEGIGAQNGPLVMGFRAEDAAVIDGVGDIEVPAFTEELLGDATMVSVKIGRDLVSVKAPKTFRAEIGAPVAVSVPKNARHLFDADTGRRLDT